MDKLITVSDAIKTTWMVLKGLGYIPEDNEQLVVTVEDVFNTAPVVEAVPRDWINKHCKRLKNTGDAFGILTANIITTMLGIWEEGNEP